MSLNLTEETKKLAVDERITLVEEIWDSIAEDNVLGRPRRTEARDGSHARSSVGARPSSAAPVE